VPFNESPWKKIRRTWLRPLMMKRMFLVNRNLLALQHHRTWNLMLIMIVQRHINVVSPASASSRHLITRVPRWSVLRISSNVTKLSPLSSRSGLMEESISRYITINSSASCSTRHTLFGTQRRYSPRLCFKHRKSIFISC
jgi:hypothetical protein